ncbi:GNAT family N-acetyltransferase [Rhizobium sp. FKL33]|uniref:GNAT family N-acetyltransferase n=1 Tax=Rhizobium sp. FKL33 TaxID=2562307 RepID=UPI0010C0B6AB|nr:GNAT family N-acetyltransferase [Rhizobium sp. FKL33]
MTEQTSLRRATAADLPRIMEIERLPGYEMVVGRSSAEFHARALNDPDYAYLVSTDETGAIGGFAILRDLGNIMGNTCLKRIAVADPGKGAGRRLLTDVIAWVFTETPTHRFWLDHIITNDRARRAYEACGLRREGVMHEAYALPDGQRVDLALMSLLRPEWAAKSG